MAAQVIAETELSSGLDMAVHTENWIRPIDRAVGANRVTLSVDDQHDKVGARDRLVSV